MPKSMSPKRLKKLLKKIKKIFEKVLTDEKICGIIDKLPPER